MKEKIIISFTNRYIIPLIVAGPALLVIASSVSGYSNRENYGQNALIYKIIGTENLEEIVESNKSASTEAQVYSYLEPSSQLQSQLFSETQNQAQSLIEDQYDNAGTYRGDTLNKPELASTEAAKITRTSVKEYAVQTGDTIGGIAFKFNISLDTIVWANNLSYRSLIKPGQKLIIPPVTGVLYKIKKNDTLAKIAKTYDASIDQIKNFNQIDNDGMLTVGKVVMIPGGRVVYTPAPVTYAPTPIPAANYEKIAPASGGKMQWPNGCYRITQYYRGWIHAGVDIACAWGTPIRAAESGVVTRVQYLKTGYGYNIIINHGGNLQTLYGHLSNIYVVPGQEVARGEIIGLEGSTGRSTGPHLHFEVRVNGSAVNPLNYIR